MNNNFLSTQAIIEFDQLNVKYRDHCILKGITGSLMPGSLTAVVGPNGGGKSTLLKTIIGFLKPSQGKLTHYSLHDQQIAYLPQQSDIDRTFPLTVYETVAMGLTQTYGFFKNLCQCQASAIQDALIEVGLKQQANHPLQILSGGQLQRVLFARMSIQKAQLLLLDEPFAAIDSSTIEDLIKIILLWHQQRKTILIVSHDYELIKNYFPETLILARECIAWGPTPKVLTNDNLKKAKNLSRNWENQLDLSFNNNEMPLSFDV